MPRKRLAPIKPALLTRARVAELADALASGASDRKVVEVRVLSRAPNSRSESLAAQAVPARCCRTFDRPRLVEQTGLLSARSSGSIICPIEPSESTMAGLR